jgi:NarL family two-component system response regulator LiaR
MTATIKVLLVDDHSIVRRGIRAFLATESDIEVVGESINGQEALMQVEQLNPDVILMDLEMPVMDGISAIRQITSDRPSSNILVLTSFSSDEKVFAAIKAGARGYLLKDSDPKELAEAIRSAQRQEPSLHPTIARKLLEEIALGSRGALQRAELSEVEIAILQHLAKGSKSQDILDQLHLSHAGYRKYVTDIMRKLHLVSRTQVVLYALREGLASIDETSPRYLDKLLAAFRQVAQDPIEQSNDPSGITPVTTSFGPDVLNLIEEYRSVAQEIALAGEIQSSFLPDEFPIEREWQFAATLEPARETSGDFYDYIRLPDRKLGIIIADVTDKGMGAALFMALSRTLLRTFALEHANQPDQVIHETNRRILADTESGLYVTAFYGVLDLDTGTLLYCNAGHHPAFIVRGQKLEVLSRSGPPLGISSDETWEMRNTQLEPSDTLILYTDGIPEAKNSNDEFFGEDRLKKSLLRMQGESAVVIQEQLLSDVHQYRGDEQQFDDIALSVVVRRDTR